MLRKLLVVMVVFSFVAGGCGDGGEDSVDEVTPDASSGPADTDVGETPDSTDPADLGDDSEESTEFVEQEGVQVRFANFYWNDGEGVAVDAYWGTDPETGELATTIEYGEVSEYLTAKKDSELVDPESLPLTFTLAGETDESAILIAPFDSVGEGDQVTFVLSASGNEVDGVEGVLLGTIWEREDGGSDLGEPDAGMAEVWFSAAGLMGLPDEEMAESPWLGTEDGCLEIGDASDRPGAINAGTLHPVGPGPMSVAAFDTAIDSGCSPEVQATDFVDVETEEGDQVLVFAYGPSVDERQLTVAPIGTG